MLSKFFWKLNRDERGTTLVLLAVFIVALLAFAALSIDVSNVFHHQRNAQAATDAGAFAAAALLQTNPPASDSAIIQEAEDITVANKVTANEIQASNVGTIQVGHWNHTNFVANATPRNAVRVPAKRNVPLMFGKVVGMSAMNPATHSIAALEGLGCITNLIPFGVSVPQLAGKKFDDTMVLNDSAISDGNQGKIDLVGYQNVPAWDKDMLRLGCGTCNICVGQFPVITGNAHVSQDFNAINGSTFIMPIVDKFAFSGNSGLATIVGFVSVQLLDSRGSGANWTATVKFIPPGVVGPGGGTCAVPCLQIRTLVQ